MAGEGWFLEDQLHKEFFEEKEFIGFFTRALNQFIYGLVGRRTLGNSYDKIPLHLMVHQSENFDVVFNANKLKTYTIAEPFIKDIQNSIHRYVNACTNKRHEFIDTINNGNGSEENLAKPYIDDVKKIHYKDFMDIAALKELRNKYLHWSVKNNFVGLGPTVQGPHKEEFRKRKTYNG